MGCPNIVISQKVGGSALFCVFCVVAPHSATSGEAIIIIIVVLLLHARPQRALRLV